MEKGGKNTLKNIKMKNKLKSQAILTCLNS